MFTFSPNLATMDRNGGGYVTPHFLLSLYLIPFLENCQWHPAQNKITSVSHHFPSIPILTTLYIYSDLKFRFLHQFCQSIDPPSFDIMRTFGVAAGSIEFNQALNNVFKLQHFNSVKGKGGGGRYKDSTKS